MNEPAAEIQSSPAGAIRATEPSTERARIDPTDRPIPIWPEGVLAVAAGVTLAVIAFRHRTWIQRRMTEAQRAVEEFQRQGGIEDLTQVARQAADMLRGSG
jgi:hypothetical protein